MQSDQSQLSANEPWYKGLTSYHWFVFAMASMAWVFDCLDQQVFILARQDALKALLPKTTETSIVTQYAAYSTSVFMINHFGYWRTANGLTPSAGFPYLAITQCLCTTSSCHSCGLVAAQTCGTCFKLQHYLARHTRFFSLLAIA
jgi:hypothetical protein